MNILLVITIGSESKAVRPPGYQLPHIVPGRTIERVPSVFQIAGEDVGGDNGDGSHEELDVRLWLGEEVGREKLFAVFIEVNIADIPPSAHLSPRHSVK